MQWFDYAHQPRRKDPIFKLTQSRRAAENFFFLLSYNLTLLPHFRPSALALALASSLAFQHMSTLPYDFHLFA